VAAGRAACHQPLAAQEVNISGLSDVNFGALRPTGEARRAHSVCVFSNLPARGYMVMAQRWF